jgi:hypothetical protein
MGAHPPAMAAHKGDRCARAGHGSRSDRHVAAVVTRAPGGPDECVESSACRRLKRTRIACRKDARRAACREEHASRPGQARGGCADLLNRRAWPAWLRTFASGRIYKFGCAHRCYHCSVLDRIAITLEFLGILSASIWPQPCVASTGSKEDCSASYWPPGGQVRPLLLASTCAHAHSLSRQALSIQSFHLGCVAAGQLLRHGPRPPAAVAVSHNSQYGLFSLTKPAPSLPVSPSHFYCEVRLRAAGRRTTSLGLALPALARRPLALSVPPLADLPLHCERRAWSWRERRAFSVLNSV